MSNPDPGYILVPASVLRRSLGTVEFEEIAQHIRSWLKIHLRDWNKGSSLISEQYRTQSKAQKLEYRLQLNKPLQEQHLVLDFTRESRSPEKHGLHRLIARLTLTPNEYRFNWSSELEQRPWAEDSEEKVGYFEMRNTANREFLALLNRFLMSIFQHLLDNNM